MAPDSANPFRVPDEALASCADEPIHTPGAIQPFGSLLALGPDALDVQYASSDFATMFGGRAALASKPAADLPFLGEAALSTLRSVAHAKRLGVQEELGSVRIADAIRTVAAHWNGRLVIVEFVAPSGGVGLPYASTLVSPREPGRLAEAELRDVIGDPQGDFDEFASRVVRRLRQLTGYERTMMYRFDDEGHGEVIAEDVAPNHERFLGLHYPATDIPSQARRLYVLNRVRQLGDVTASSISVLSLGPSKPLDLSYAVLRDFSPVHREYLSNMGVGATLVASIVVGGALWGLLVCHHDKSYWPPVEARKVIETLAELVAGHIALRMAYDAERSERRFLALREHFASVRDPSALQNLIQERGDELRTIGAADGLVICIGDAVQVSGSSPPVAVIKRLVDALAETEALGSVFSAASIGEVFPALQDDLGEYVGVMVVRGAWGYAAWLRKDVAATVRWAGRTDKSIVHAADGSVRLVPRKSFEAWVALAGGKARPFEPSEVRVADWFRSWMVEHELGVRTREREAAARALQAKNAQLALAVTAGRVAVWTLKEGERLPTVGDDFFALLGYPADRALREGGTFEKVLHPDDVDEVTLRFSEMAGSRGQSTEFDFRALGPSGSWYWFHAAGSSRDEHKSGSVVCMGTFADVTDLRRAIEALSVARARAAETDKLRALGQLAGGIAHNFNNTLAAIAWSIELLTESPETPEQIRKPLDRVLLSAREGAASIKELRHFIRGSSVNDRSVESANLSEIVRSAVELTRPRWESEATARGATIQVSVEAPHPVFAQIAPWEAQDVLVNLMLNAADSIRTRGRIVLRAETLGSQARVTVEDDGVGMDAETSRRCFEPFFSTKGDRGTGLGLFSAWTTAHRRQGTLEVRSEPARGSKFTLTLPVANPAELGEKVSRADKSAIAGRRIAVVDDDSRVLDALVSVLAASGATVRSFASGKALIDALQLDPSLDAVITDLGMPDLDGRGVARYLAREYPMIPVILLTGWGEALSEEEERENGIRAVLAKPIGVAGIRQTLERVMANKSPS